MIGSLAIGAEIFDVLSCGKLITGVVSAVSAWMAPLRRRDQLLVVVLCEEVRAGYVQRILAASGQDGENSCTPDYQMK